MSTLTLSAWQPQISWNHKGSTASLRIQYSDEFIDSLGQQIVRGLYKTVPCTIFGGVLSIPSFSLPTTNDALVNPLVTCSARLFDQGGASRDWLFQQFVLPQSLAPATTIGALSIYNLARDLVLPSESFLNRDEVLALIASTIGSINYASDVIAGRTALDIAPISAIFPIAVGRNSPLVAAAVGSDVLVAGLPTTILSSLVAIDTPIVAVGAADTISGNLRVVPGSRVAGVSFQVESDNGADAGTFRWFLYGGALSSSVVSSGSNEAILDEPTGTIDGINPSVLTLPHTPVANTETVFVNGIARHRGVDYTIVGAVITTIIVLDVGDWVAVTYRW